MDCLPLSYVSNGSLLSLDLSVFFCFVFNKNREDPNTAWTFNVLLVKY